MANRSYLYASDAIPDGATKIAPRGLSECNYDIPLVHKLMIANAPRRVPSAIWNQPIGILADRAGAAERAVAFVAKVLEGHVTGRDQLTADFGDMQRLLASTAALPYVLLEVGEILDMEGGDLVEGATALVDEIPKLVARVDRALAGKENDWLAELRAKGLESFNLGAWSHVLYFSFDDATGSQEGEAEPAEPAEPVAPKKPAKKAAPKKAAPKKAAPKKAAKKPPKKAAPKKAAPKKAAPKKAAKKPTKKAAPKKAAPRKRPR